MKHTVLVLAIALLPVDFAGVKARQVRPANLRWSADSQKLYFEWRKAHRRVLCVDGGDIVMVDSAAGVRRQITRTTGAESNPRWARNDTLVTYVSDGNLFIVPVAGAASAIVSQLTDIAPERAEPKLTDNARNGKVT